MKNRLVLAVLLLFLLGSFLFLIHPYTQEAAEDAAPSPQQTVALPDGYSLKPYIILDYTKTSYFNTGISPTLQTGIDITFQQNGLDIYAPIFSAYQSEEHLSTRLILSSNAATDFLAYSMSRAGGGYTLVQVSSAANKLNYVQLGTEYTMTDLSAGATQTNALVRQSGLSLPANTMITLGAPKARTSGTLHLFGCKLYNGETLVRSYVPALRESDSVFGLYDLVEHKFLEPIGKAATGPFCTYQDPRMGEIFAADGVFYLPAYTDFRNMGTFSLPKGTLLSGTTDATLSADANSLDLTALFGEMEAGKTYTVKTELDGKRTGSFQVMKSENLSTVSLSLNGSLEAVNRQSLHTQKGAEALVLQGGLEKWDTRGIAIASAKIGSFKARGNWTWESSLSKKPYNINLENKVELIEGAGSSKKWALMSNLWDNGTSWTAGGFNATGLNRVYLESVFQALDPAVSLSSEFVDLYINGDYRGTYLLSERVSADRFPITTAKYEVEDKTSTTRVVQSHGIKTVDFSIENGLYGSPTSGQPDDGALPCRWHALEPTVWKKLTAEEDLQDPLIAAGIQAYQYATHSKVATDQNGGYIVEFARSHYADLMGEASWFITRKGQAFVLKEPGYASLEQLQRMALYIQAWEDALFAPSGYNSQGKHYSDYIDLDTFAKQYYVQVSQGNGDFLASSTILYVDADPVGGAFTSKLLGDVCWDTQTSGEGKAFAPKELYYAAYATAPYSDKLLLRGDFMNKIYQLHTSLAVQNATSDEAIAASYSTSAAHTRTSQRMTLQRYQLGLNFDQGLAIQIQNMKGRYARWKGFWDPETYLLGVTATYKDGALVGQLTADSKATHLRWCKVNEDGSLAILSGATSLTYTPTEQGIYVLAATGPNMAHTLQFASLHMASTTVTMYSNPVFVGN